MLHCAMILMHVLTCSRTTSHRTLPFQGPMLQIAKVGTKKEDEDHSEADMSVED